MIHFKNITKKYNAIKALDDISLKVDRNEFIGIVGNNGSGKTTLINALCNLISLDNGAVYFDENKITPASHSYKKNFGVILSDPYFIEEFSTKEYLSFFAKFQGISNAQYKTRIKKFTDFIAIDDINQPIMGLSAGNKMKVSITASLIHNPSILVYDEPFVNLDINTSNKLKEIILSFKGKKTLLITSHHLDLVVDICDRFVILDEGRIVKSIKKSDFNSKEEIFKVFKDKMVIKTEHSKLNWLQ